MATYSPGRRLIDSYPYLVVRGVGTRIDRTITHGCEDFEEKKKSVTGRENQEVRGSVLADLVEKARDTTNTGKTSITTFHGIYDDKQGQGVCGENGIGHWDGW